MNFKPLRATLVFLFALSATACSGGTGVMPITPGASDSVATSAPNVVGTLPTAAPSLHANDLCQAPLLAGHYQRNDSTCSGGTGSCPVTVDGCTTITSPSGMGPPSGWNNCTIGCSPTPPCDPNMCGPHVPNPRPILPPGLVAHVFGPAKFGDTCSANSQQIGQPVEGRGPVMSSAIINEYPINIWLNPILTGVVGYVYTTWGSGNGQRGNAYFSPISGGVGVGVISIGVGGALYVGPNSITQNVNGMVTTLTKLLGKKTSAALGNGDACFSKDWDGTFPG